MSSTDGEGSRDQDLKHQSSFSDSGRFSVPMWDSSDPDRAPPPLPLNPGSSSPITRPNTSANVAAAAEAFAAKARESTYTVNPMPIKSPERSLIKGQYHKRLQSIQNPGSNIRDLSSYLENPRPTDRSPERLSRSSFENENKSPDRSPIRSGTPTPSGRDMGRDIPSLRPARPPPKAILGENTPQSATMLALQNTPTPKDRDTPLQDITNGSTALVRTPQSFDAISTQILSLTGIATNLQREMAQLSRRSKDNATDLISLKEATNARDEDIRKSLRDLVSNLQSQSIADHTPRIANQYLRGAGSYLIDDKPHISPIGMAKSVSLPRIPSPTSFAATIEREIANSPSPYSLDGAASIALLEKILREMGTKEGQERLISSISEIRNRTPSNESDPVVTKKLEEILGFLKDNSNSRALVTRRDYGNGIGDRPPKLELDFENLSPIPVARSSRNITPYGNLGGVKAEDNRRPRLATKGVDFVSEDILKLLKRMKDSIAEGGGMSAEIKALVRELRGEVLGMGREIGRKLDQAESTQKQSSSRNDARGPGRDEIARIVEDGLAQLKEHMDRVMQERRRQSSSSAISRSTIDSQEVYLAVKNALSEMPIQQQVAVQQGGSGIEREEILEAVREAWETYKPEIELQNFGLERDEILQCLKEGLQEYQPQEQSKELGGASYEEVLEAVQEGLKKFKPPPVETEASVTREEILMAVRECLESFEFPNLNHGRDRENEITREDVLDAVKEGLSAQAPIAREIEFNRDDLFDAVKAGLEGAPTPMAGVGEQVLDKIQDLIDGMRGEFKQYSAANGRDTEQVLDAMKDGLEVLRAGIETYVDRAADVTGKDEIIETVRDGLEHLRIDLEGSIASAPRDTNSTDNGELLDAMEKEFEHLRQTIATSIVHSGGSNADKDEILDTIRDGLDEIKREMPHGESEINSDTIATLKEEFDHLRETLATTLTRSGSAVDREEISEIIRESLDGVRLGGATQNSRTESIISNTGELLDAFNDGLDGLKADLQKIINKPIDMTVNYEILDTLKEGLLSVRADIDRLHAAHVEQESVSGRRGGEVVIADENPKSLERNDIENLEVMITQLRIKVESLDNMTTPPAASQAGDGSMTSGDLERLEAIMKDVQANMALLGAQERSAANAVTKDDTDAIETLLRNTKAKIDEMVSPDYEGTAKTVHLDSIEAVIKSTRDAIEDVATRQEFDTASKTDVGVLEALLKEVRAGMEDVREKGGFDGVGQSVRKADIEALETLCLDTKTQIDEIVDSLPTKSGIAALDSLVKDFREKVEVEADLTAQAFESRKIEHGGIADKIEGVKSFLEDIRKELKSKINGSEEGIENLATTLSAVGAALFAEDGTSTIQQLKEVLTREFEMSHSNYESVKLDTEQHRDVLLTKHDELKDNIIADLASKIDERFDEMMTKYDDAQIAADANTASLNGKEGQQSEALNATRSIVEDLKILIDALGSGVTDSCDRMGHDSKTVFNRVEDVATKLDVVTTLLTTGSNVDHQLTRAEVSKVLVAIEGVQAHTTDYSPKLMSAINEVLNMVGQHYEQAQRSTEEIKTTVNAIPSSIPMQAIKAALPSPLPLERELLPPEKYDDSAVHVKLDKLVENASIAADISGQFEMLERIKAQVELTAGELTDFLREQKCAITESHESHAREAEEVAVAVEKRRAQKENVESEIIKLSEEKQTLSISVVELKKDEQDLAMQKARLQADLSSLETALQIRREEMQLMETRAEGLERRILEGVLDHSRSLLINSKPQSSLKAMNLKRVASTTSNTSVSTMRTSTIGTTIPTSAGSALSNGLGMALKRRQPLSSKRSMGSNKGDRRILSLSTISTNKGHPVVERSMVLANPSLIGPGAGKGNAAFGSGGLKRSHSVKSNFPVRKTSWGGTRQGGMYGDDVEEDKENSILDEEDEDAGSDGATERRSSFSTETDRNTIYSGTYTGTGSYGTGSVDEDDDRRNSYGASTVGTVGLLEAGTDDEDEEPSQDGSNVQQEALGKVDLEDQHITLYQGDMAYPEPSDTQHGMVVFGLPSDSGIGTDIPTAALDGVSDYFRKH
ncbi:hypothetical protein MMC17_003999 [Xylographa soralifera]|nr:hypothetical protein [Xylographa soralifera]